MAVEYLMWTLVFAMMLYMLLLIVITWGWFSLKYFNGHETSPQISISVVVAVRNEESNIGLLLKDLVNQNYPNDLFEIVIVDDNSEDLTRTIVINISEENPQCSIRLMQAKSNGKKAALAEGIDTANGELIVTTDGDCTMGAEWLTSIVGFYTEQKPVLIIAPVVYQNEKGILQKLFSLDFVSLVASGAGSAGARLPFMGNGANLSFTKIAWQRASSGQSGDSLASGDDVFLIHRIARIFGNKSIQFLKAPSAIVRTNPPASFRDFFQQRIRWASKAKAYKSPWAIFVPVVVLAVNFLIAITFFAGFFKAWFFIIYGLFVVLKLLIDLPLLVEFTGFVNKRKLLVLAFPLALIYPLYIVVAAFPAMFFRFEWKGRKGLR